MQKRFKPLNFRQLSVILLLSHSTPGATTYIDRIVAVVEESVIVESEFEQKLNEIKNQLSQTNAPLPPERIIRRQVLERMIINSLQRDMADQSGVRVNDETLQNSMSELAQRNNLSTEEFRQALQEGGLNYATFVEEMRNEIKINQFRTRHISSRVKVTEREIAQFMEIQGQSGSEKGAAFHLGHILIATPEAASPTQIHQVRQKAERIVSQLQGDVDFAQIATRVSDGGQALNGGDLGWRKLSQLPTLFVEIVAKMTENEIQGPIHSPSGFHIIKLLGRKGATKYMITQSRVKHILIKTNEITIDEVAQDRLLKLKHRIENGENFDEIARSHSDDTTSALNGGDLGWINPGQLVPEFEEAMNKIEINLIGEPIKTKFGWHLIQVVQRQKTDNTAGYQKALARDEIRKRKIEEETGIWLRRIRDEAYVDIRMDE